MEKIIDYIYSYFYIKYVCKNCDKIFYEKKGWIGGTRVKGDNIRTCSFGCLKELLYIEYPSLKQDNIDDIILYKINRNGIDILVNK